MKIEHTKKDYGLKKAAQAFPRMCVLGLSYVCNSRCPSCPYTHSTIRDDYKDKPFMDEDTFKIIADQCGENKAWVRISGGGEPTLHPKAVEFMVYAKKQGAKVGLITNGSKLTEKMSVKLIEAQIDMIEFSVDAADPLTYALVRPGLNWGVLFKNVSRIVELRNKLKSKTKVIVSGIHQKGVDIEAVERFWTPLVDNFQKRKYLTWGVNDPLKSADPTPYLPPEQHIPCPFIFERLNIDSKGKVVVCGFDIFAVTNIGNVREKRIQEIWHGEELEYYRKLHLAHRGHEIKLCRDCTDWKYRSWQHNYWKIVSNAEENRIKKFNKLNYYDTEGCITEF